MSISTMWVEKYRPKAVDEMVGNEESRIRFLNWLKNWKIGHKPALLLGPPGTGKTTLVYAASQELGYRVLELNASDVRTKSRLEQIVGPLIDTTNLLNEKQIIFLDEVDGISGRQDYGGVEFLMELIQKGLLPIVMVANREDYQKMRKLVSRSEVMKFKRITPRMVELYLNRILQKEGIQVDRDRVVDAVKVANGDMRAAINTLQSSIQAEESALQRIDIQLSMEEALNIFFNAETSKQAYEALQSVQAMPREKIRAFYSSILSSPIDEGTRLKLLDELWKADQLARRIERTQEWRLLRYFNRILAYSIYKAMPKGVMKYGEEDLPWSIKLRIWNEGRIIRELCKRIARLSHISSRDAASLYLPYLIFLMSRSEGFVDRVIGILGVDESSRKVLVKEMNRISKEIK